MVHLPSYNSDHCPLWIRAGDFCATNIAKPFRFLAACLNHSDLKNLVENNWNNDLCWHDNISQFTKSATSWNSNVFGQIFFKKRRLMSRLHGIQRSLSQGPNPFLEDLQSQLWLEYESTLFEEETLWAQKSRQD